MTTAIKKKSSLIRSSLSWSKDQSNARLTHHYIYTYLCRSKNEMGEKQDEYACLDPIGGSNMPPTAGNCCFQASTWGERLSPTRHLSTHSLTLLSAPVGPNYKTKPDPSHRTGTSRWVETYPS